MDNSYEKPSPDEKVLFRNQFEAEELLIANSTLTRTKKRTTRKPRERVILDLGFCNNFSFSFSIDVCYFYSLIFGSDLYIICPMKFK